MKGFNNITPSSYSTDDNDYSAVEGMPIVGNEFPKANVSMAGSVYNQTIEVTSTLEAMNMLVGQNAKKDADNARLYAENEQLIKQNQILKEKQKKVGHDWHIIDYKGNLCLWQNFYGSTVYLAGRIINTVVMVKLDTEEEMKLFYLIMSEGSQRGQLLIKEKDLYTDRLVNRMKSYLESPLNVEGYIKKTHLKDLITQYLIGKINSEHRGIVLHEHAGWYQKKWFSADFKDENTAKLLKAEFSELPLLKRQWKTSDKIGGLPELDPEDECAYLCIMVGAVCLSIFKDAGIKYTPVAWIENTPENQNFLQSYCTFWQGYIETVEADSIYNKRSFYKAFASAKDETVLVLSGDGKSKRCCYIDELVDSAYYGYPYRQKVEIRAVPIITSDEFYSYVDGAEREMPILPILFGGKFLSSDFCIADFLHIFVKWIEQNYDEVLGVISFVKEKAKSDMRSFFYSVLCLYWLHQNHFPSGSFCIELEQVGFQEAKETADKMIAKVQAFLYQDSLEIIRSAIFKFQTNSVLKIQAISAVIEEEDFDKVDYLIYDSDGTCYIKNESFCQIVDKNTGIPSKILLKKLSVDGAIQYNQNGNGRITNSCNVRLHFREREKTVKMIRFFPGKLMNSEGAAFGGELL